MGTQTEIVKQIRHKKADYIVSLKANHPTLHSQVKEWFDTIRANNFEGINVSYNQQIEKGHHRTEKRYVWAVPLEALVVFINKTNGRDCQPSSLLKESAILGTKRLVKSNFI